MIFPLLSNMQLTAGFRTMLVAAVPLALAAISCAVAWQRTRQTPWIWIALGYALMSVEAFARTRHLLSRWGIALVGPQLYLQRRTPQLIVCAILGLLAVAAILFLARSAQSRGRGIIVAAAGLLTAFYLYLLAAISAHQIDQLLYFPAAGIFLAGWAWAFTGTLGVLGALAPTPAPHLPRHA